VNRLRRASDPVVFSTTNEPNRHRLAAWQDFMCANILCVRVLADVKRGFEAEAAMLDFGHLSLTRYRIDPQMMARDVDQSCDGDVGVTFSLVESGQIIAERGGRSVRLMPRQGILQPANASTLFRFVEPTVFWGIKLQHDADFESINIARCLARENRAVSGPPVDIILGYCDLVAHASGAARQRARDAVVEAILHLIAANAPSGPPVRLPSA
jgi:hypothetical protein